MANILIFLRVVIKSLQVDDRLSVCIDIWRLRAETTKLHSSYRHHWLKPVLCLQEVFYRLLLEQPDKGHGLWHRKNGFFEVVVCAYSGACHLYKRINSFKDLKPLVCNLC